MRSERGKTTLRCAIYTRVSTEHGLEQEFNSLDNQREAAEAYVKSQAHEGWKLIRTHYDDGGFSGGSIDRPALDKRENANSLKHRSTSLFQSSLRSDPIRGARAPKAVSSNPSIKRELVFLSQSSAFESQIRAAKRAKYPRSPSRSRPGKY